MTKKRHDYAKERMVLTNLLRLYAVAGDRGNSGTQRKIRRELRTARRNLTGAVGEVLGTFAGTEAFELFGEYISSIRNMVDAGDKNLRDAYGKGLNTLRGNKEKRLEYIRSHLNPTDEELQNMDGLLNREVIHLSGYILCRDRGLMEDESRHWEDLKQVSAQMGEIIEGLLHRRKEFPRRRESRGEPDAP